MCCIEGFQDRVVDQRQDAADPCRAMTRSVGYNTLFAGVRVVENVAAGIILFGVGLTLKPVAYGLACCCTCLKSDVDEIYSGDSAITVKNFLLTLADTIVAIAQMIPVVGNFIAYPIYMGCASVFGENSLFERGVPEPKGPIDLAGVVSEQSPWTITDEEGEVHQLERGKRYYDIETGEVCYLGRRGLVYAEGSATAVEHIQYGRNKILGEELWGYLEGVGEIDEDYTKITPSLGEASDLQEGKIYLDLDNDMNYGYSFSWLVEGEEYHREITPLELGSISHKLDSSFHEPVDTEIRALARDQEVPKHSGQRYQMGSCICWYGGASDNLHLMKRPMTDAEAEVSRPR